MVFRILAIAFIFCCASVAWFILGATIQSRTYNSDDKLRSGVAAIWGAPQEQTPPTASYEVLDHEREQLESNGRKTTRIVDRRRAVGLPIDASRINVNLALEHRQKGLLWYSTY